MNTQSKRETTSMFHELKLDQFRLFCAINKAKDQEYCLVAFKKDEGWILTAPSKEKSARLVLSNVSQLRIFKSLDTMINLIESGLGGVNLKVVSPPRLR